MGLRDLNAERVLGTPRTGVLAALIPDDGEHGPALGYTALLPEYAGKEVRVKITRMPSGGDLWVNEDSSFIYDGPSDSLEYVVLVNAAPTNETWLSPITVGAASHSLTGAATAQANASSSGAIGTQGTLLGGNTTQASTTSAGQVIQTHIIIAAAVAADAQASASSVVQTHLLLGAGTIQFVESTAGAIDLTFIHSLSGSAANQTAQATSGVITQSHVLVGADTYATPVISGGVIGQTHKLLGSPVYQWQVSSTGATYTGVIPYFIDMSRILLVRSGGTRGRVHRTA